MSGVAAIVATGGQAFQASASPSSVSGSTFDPSPALSNQTTVSTLFGLAPFAYAWSQVSGDSIVIQSPSSVSTRFSGAPASQGQSLVGVFVCTVTDAIGAVAVTNQVTATLSWQ